jgi:hypothetical protein
VLVKGDIDFCVPEHALDGDETDDEEAAESIH